MPSRPRAPQFRGELVGGVRATSPQAKSNAGRLVHGVGILYGVALHRKCHMLAPAGFIAVRPFHDTGVSAVFIGIETGPTALGARAA